MLTLNGETDALMWTHRVASTPNGNFNGVAVDPATDWVVAVGLVDGTWLPGGAQGDYDFVGIVVDGDTGVELTRYQDGTVGR